MSISVSISATASNTSLIDKSAVAADTAKMADVGTPADKARLQLNASIVQSTLSVSIGAQNEPLALVLKSAITNINEALKGQYGDDAIQNAMGQDNTPEGTAGRIVGLSTAFFEAYKQQHVGEDPQAVLDKFMSTIKGGMERGFQEARDILTGLNVLNGGVASNVDKTYELVQKGYADFAAAQGAAIKAAPAN